MGETRPSPVRGTQALSVFQSSVGARTARKWKDTEREGLRCREAGVITEQERCWLALLQVCVNVA